MKNWKIIIIALILVVAIGIAVFVWKDSATKINNLEKQNVINDDNTTNTKEILLNVANSKQKFIDEDNNEILFNEFKIVENETAKVKQYTFVDLDKDGTEELVIDTTSEYGAYVILHYENNKVYGYKINVRALENLKTDGSFIGSSGAGSNEYLTMTFNKNSYTTIKEAVYDENDKVYKISNKDVTEKEIKEYATKWNQKEDVKWNK